MKGPQADGKLVHETEGQNAIGSRKDQQHWNRKSECMKDAIYMSDSIQSLQRLSGMHSRNQRLLDIVGERRINAINIEKGPQLKIIWVGRKFDMEIFIHNWKVMRISKRNQQLKVSLIGENRWDEAVTFPVLVPEVPELPTQRWPSRRSGDCYVCSINTTYAAKEKNYLKSFIM